MNIIYSVSSIVSLSLYWVSRYPKKTNYIVPAYAIVALRSVVRLCDLENTRLTYNMA